MKVVNEETFDEVGGNFWVETNHKYKKSATLSKDIFYKDAQDIFYTSSGRSAIRLYLKQRQWNKKIALLPYFICESVIIPFLDNGFKIFYYELEKDFSINIEKLASLIQKVQPSLLFLQSYFGFDTLKSSKNYISNLRRETKINIVEDITHSIFGNNLFSDAHFYVGSLRNGWEYLMEES